MFNVGVSLGANRNMVNAGVTHKFGSSPEKRKIFPDRYKAGPISSVYVMQDEASSLKKKIVNKKLLSRIKRLVSIRWKLKMSVNVKN